MRPFGICLAALAVVFLLGATASNGSDPVDEHPDLHLIPWPKLLQRGTGTMLLSSASRIIIEDAQLKPLGEVLAGELSKLVGLELVVVPHAARAGDIVLKINKDIEANEPLLVVRNREIVRTKEGAHTITIGEQAVVSGFDYRATAEGTATLLQLLGKTEGAVRLPRATIKDWPHADYCGVMLDVARQDHPIEAIKNVVQLCRLYKARYLQLHLTDDQGWTFPSTRYPQLGSRNYGAHGGVAPRVYKLEELKELVAYADARGVTLVPELEMPGHSDAALRSLPEIFDAINPQSRQPVRMGCMNMSNEEIYPALDAIIGEMCDVFRSSPYFHIGSDEVTFGRLALHRGYQAFLAKHGLKDDHQLAEHFVAAVCVLIQKHGKKAIKWEGLANTATKDVIIMAWDNNSNVASEMLARGYTTITCPWNLGVPWEQWNMYVCNASRLKKGDSVLGATLVAWEQPPLTHITNLRNLPSRQERTWGPDNAVTVEGFAARFQPLDAKAGRLLDMLPRPRLEATFATALGTSDLLEPVFAFDGNDASFFKSARAPSTGDHFTVTFKESKLIHAIEVLTGCNRHGLFDGGEVQVCSDGKQFVTVARLESGSAKVMLKEPRIHSVRLLATAEQREPLILRAINLQLLVEVSGRVSDPSTVFGTGNVAAVKGDTELAYPIGTCTVPIINRGYTLKLNNGGNACSFDGPISGIGRVEFHAGGASAPLVLAGQAANSMQGSWTVKSGHVALAKPSGVDAMRGTIIVGGASDQDALVWHGNNQLHDESEVELLASAEGGAALHLNGFSDAIRRLTMAAGTHVLTDGPNGGGTLLVKELTIAGQRLPPGVYTSSNNWLRGRGLVLVGEVKQLPVAGVVTEPNQTLGAGNLAVLQGPTTFGWTEGGCSIGALTGEHPLTLAPGGSARFDGVVTGRGSVVIAVPSGQTLEIGGASSNSYQGTTTLSRGVLKLNKTSQAIAISGDLKLGGSAAENQGDTVVWCADGQVAPSAIVTLEGSQPSYLDLNGHRAVLSKVVLSRAGKIRTGQSGTLRVKQLFVEGRRLPDSVYQIPQPWLDGNGSVTVDSRVDVSGVIGSPERVIGAGNQGSLTGDTKIAYPSSGGDYDIATNGHTLTFDSGDGNAFAYAGSISGNGSVEFYMGPSYTGFKDAPLRLIGSKPNTATGKFYVKKGRVQLEKPEGVDAISGDVIIGGQGFNDCLFWMYSHQLKDSIGITLLDAGNNGAAYLHLNGCKETAARLTMTANNRILTDSVAGSAGSLIVKSLVIDGVAKPAGSYGAAMERWIVGKGSVIVRP